MLKKKNNKEKPKKPHPTEYVLHARNKLVCAMASFPIDLMKDKLDPMLSAIAVSELPAHVQCNSVKSEIPEIRHY